MDRRDTGGKGKIELIKGKIGSQFNKDITDHIYHVYFVLYSDKI